MEPDRTEAPSPPLAELRLWLAIGLGAIGGILGLSAWLGVTLRTGQYRAFLASGVALGIALGVRAAAGPGGRRAQVVGLAMSLPAIAVGQYLAVCLLWRDAGIKEAALRHGTAPAGLLVGLGRFLQGWERLWDPRREAIFLAVSLLTVLWLLRQRRPRP